MRDLKYLSPSQRRGLEMFEDERSRIDLRESQFLAACAIELGADPNDPTWTFSRNDRAFERIADYRATALNEIAAAEAAILKTRDK